MVCSTEGEIELVWIDWECATPVGSIARSLERIGTIDTMSVQALEGFSVVHEPYQELESGEYLVWKLTMTNRRLVIRAEDKTKFAERWELYYWEVPGAPGMVAKTRRAMWGEDVLIEAPLSQVGGTGRDLIMMAKSLPVEIFFIHGCSQIPELYPRAKGLPS